MAIFIQIPDWHIPDVVWGGIGGSLITLLGAWLSNRNSRKQLRMQLDHAARQDDRKRQMELRKEVYVHAAEAIMRCNATLLKLGNPDESESALSNSIQDNFATLAKTHVVGSERTVEAVMTYQATLAQAFATLMVKRLSLKARYGQVQSMASEIRNEVAERDRCLGQIKQSQLTVSLDARVVDALNRQMQESQNRLRVLEANHAEVSAAFGVDQRNFALEASRIGADVSKLLAPAVLAVRAEMDLPIDGKAYIDMYEGAAVLAVKTVEQMVAGVEKFNSTDD